MSDGRYDRGTWVRVKNTYGTEAPAGAIAKITGYEASTDALKVTRPNADNLPNIIVVDEAIAAGGYGIGYESGTVSVQLFAGETPAVDARIGSKQNSWLAKESDGGGLIVRDILGSVAFAWIVAGRRGSQVAPCKITSGSGNTYTGNIYGNGRDQAATETGVTIKVLQIDSGDTVPADTELMAYKPGITSTTWTVDVARYY